MHNVLHAIKQQRCSESVSRRSAPDWTIPPCIITAVLPFIVSCHIVFDVAVVIDLTVHAAFKVVLLWIYRGR